MSPPNSLPTWLIAAWAEYGQSELAGSATNPHIAALFRDSGHPQITDDETAWCSAFVGACLERVGIASTKSLAARSYLTWGNPASRSQVGSIVVLSRGSDPALGHVGLYLGETTNEVILLGGNQSDGVTVAPFSKSRVLAMRWPSALRAAEVQTTPVPAVFDVALSHVLKMEGGYSNDPVDPGGPTNFGITLADFASHEKTTISNATRPTLIANLQNIPPTTVREIYETKYWRAAGCSHLPASIAIFHFDCAVNMGVGTAIRMLQTSLGCDIDGELGPVTILAAANANPAVTLETYANLRRHRYRSLTTYARFGRGWFARVDATIAVAVPFTHSSLSPKGPSPMPSAYPSSQPTAIEPKWWGNSLTIWGAVVAGLAAVVPIVGPAVGVEISSETIHMTGDQVAAASQALLGIAGTLAAIFGRVRASQPLMRRELNIKL
jgi:uncharacterized protein (TIGR02594 family)